MSNLNRHPVRRAAVGVLAGTLAFTGGAIAAGVSPANALPGFTFERLAGADRFGTAAAIARDGFGTAETVILASGATRNFPDALTGNFLAGDEQAPILLTQPGSLPRVTSDAFTSLNTRRVIIVGGTSAVSAEVERQVRSRNITVERVGGIDRYATAELVAQRVAGSTPATSTAVGEDPSGLRTAILGNGQDFPDILASGPLSFAEAFPIAITPNTSSTLDPRTRDVLEDLDIERVIIVGGTTAVTPGVEAEVRQITNNNVTRLAGTQRFQTAIAVAVFAYDQLDFDESHINLARSDDFADALTGGPHGGLETAPIVITTPTSLHPATQAFLERRCPTLTDGHIFGGVVAISNATEAAAKAAASNCENPAPPAPAAQATVDVTNNNDTVEAGQPVTGTITATNGTIQSVTVSGCGLNNEPVEDSSTAAGFQFSETIPANQPAGQCTLTFTVTFTDGTTDTDTVTITVTRQAPQPTPSPTPTPQPQPDTPTATITSATLGDTNTIGLADRGDTFTLTFSERVTADSATIDIRDNDGDTARIQCVGTTVVNGTAVPAEPAADANNTTSANCQLSADGRTLTVQLLERAEDTNIGTGRDNGIQFPAEIIAIDNVRSANGQQVNLAGSPDRTIN